jgi:hypothetical protein
MHFQYNTFIYIRNINTSYNIAEKTNENVCTLCNNRHHGHRKNGHVSLNLVG